MVVGFFQQHCWDQKQNRGFPTWLKERKPITVPSQLGLQALPATNKKNQSKAKTSRGTCRFDQPRVSIPSSPNFTYLSRVFFHWLYNHGKILSSDFPVPWGRLLQMPNKRIWENINKRLLLLGSFQVLSPRRVINFPKHLGSTFFKCTMQARKTREFSIWFKIQFGYLLQMHAMWF